MLAASSFLSRINRNTLLLSFNFVHRRSIKRPNLCSSLFKALRFVWPVKRANEEKRPRNKRSLLSAFNTSPFITKPFFINGNRSQFKKENFLVPSVHDSKLTRPSRLTARVLKPYNSTYMQFFIHVVSGQVLYFLQQTTPPKTFCRRSQTWHTRCRH